MKIAYNPKTAAALTSAPANNDITFDLSGLSIYVRGERFKGTDTTYTVFKKHDSGDSGGYDGLVPVPNYNGNSLTRYLREDGTWLYATDVKLSEATDTDFRPIVLGLTHSATLTELVNPVTGQVYVTSKIYACPSTGILYATKLYSNGKEVLTEHQSLADYVTLNTPLTITGRKTFYSLVNITNGTTNDDGTLYTRPIIYMDSSLYMIYSDTKSHTIIRGSAIRIQTSNGVDTVNILPDTIKTLAKIESSQTIKGTLLISTETTNSPLVVSSSTVVAKLNSDLLDGYHASGLFEKLDNDGNNLSITIGGTKKNLIVNYAAQSGKLGYSIKFKNITYQDVVFDGSLDIDLTSGIYHSDNSDLLLSHDTRFVNNTPKLFNSGARFEFKTNTTDGLNDGETYHGILHFRPYGLNTDFSGGLTHLLGFTDNGNLYIRTSTNSSTWGGWHKILHSGNLSGFYWANVNISNHPSTLTNPSFASVTLNHPTEAGSSRGVLKYYSGSHGWGDYFISDHNGPHISLLPASGGNVYLDSTTIVSGDISLNNIGSIRQLAVNGGIYWNPYVESSSDNTDAASITVLSSGGPSGGTTLRISQQNDSNDTIQFSTHASSSLYHNDKKIATLYNTYVSGGKGYLFNTEITQVNNSDTVDGLHGYDFTRTQYDFCSTSDYSMTSCTDFATWVSRLSSRSGILGTSSITTGAWWWVRSISLQVNGWNIQTAGAMVIHSGNGNTSNKNYKHFLILDAYSELYGITSNEESWKTYARFLNSNNYTSYVNPRATSKTIWGLTYIDANGNFLNVNNLLYVTANGNTTTIGSLNGSYCHIYNSADVPFIFNRSVYTIGNVSPYGGNTYQLGDSSNKWKHLYLSNRAYLDEWIQFSGATGLYWPNTNGAHLYANTTTSYGALITLGSRGGYCGLHCGPNNTYMTVMSHVDHLGLYNESRGRWSIYYNRPNDRISIYDSNTDLGYGVQINQRTGIKINSYPSLHLVRTDAGETSMYFSNNTAGWAIGINPWGVGAGLFAIGLYAGTGGSYWRFRIDNNGYCFTRSYLNLGAGNEKNASNPPYVWGVNGSDNYLRTYATSSLSVGYSTYSSYLTARYSNCGERGASLLYLWYDWNNTGSLGTYFHGLWCGSPDGNIGYQLAYLHLERNRLWMRTWDYGTWNPWYALRTSADTYVSTYGVIGGAEIPCIRHLLINGVTWWSNWYWSGLGGQPTWLWGSNNGSDMYVWNPSNFSVNYANSAGSARCIYTGSCSGDTHAVALQNYFNSNKSTVPRNSLISMYSSAYSNGSLYFGYYLSGYENNPYGGFYVAHYSTPYYVGISNGSFWLQLIITSGTIGSQSVNYATYSRYVYCTSGSYLNFQWSGLSGQPTWLFGSNDGANVYVWNPRNFSVNYASSAGTASKLSTNAGSSAIPVYFSGGIPVACGYSFRGGSYLPIVIFSGLFYRSGSTWYYDSGKSYNITSSSPSVSISGARMYITLLNTNIVNGIVMLNESSKVSSTTTNDVRGNSEGIFWFSVYANASNYIYIRPYCLGDKDNDTWLSKNNAWTTFLNRINVTLIGYYNN